MKKHICEKKQKEYQKHISSNKIEFNELLHLINVGIKDKIKKTDLPVSNQAFRKGLYLGCPGKDIYFSLPNLTDEQLEILALSLAKQYPSKPPAGHVGYAACIRYIYGCFDKQGCLCSPKHAKMMAEENEDWSLPDKFMNRVLYFMIENNCKYGQIIYHEMKGHRIGDRILIDKDYKMKDKMLKEYQIAQNIGIVIKSYKHTFTPFFWAAFYLEKFDPKLAIKYHIKSLIMMEKYCPDAREGYREKAIHSLIYLKKKLNKSEWDYHRKWLMRCKKKCLVKIRKKFM